MKNIDYMYGNEDEVEQALAEAMVKMALEFARVGIRFVPVPAVDSQEHGEMLVKVKEITGNIVEEVKRRRTLQ